MKVIAAKGLQVPKEAQPREYITDQAAQDVQPSAYYLRMVADGDLLDVTAEQAKSPAHNKGAA